MSSSSNRTRHPPVDSVSSAYLFDQSSSSSSSSLHRLHKRGQSGQFSGRATYYDVGLGACGETNTNDQFIVALNKDQYNANHWCKKYITIYYGGKSQDAQIMDQCPGCPYGALDLSPALFKVFASEDAGVFYMSWSLKDDNGGGGSPPPAPAKEPEKNDKPAPEPAPAPAPVIRPPNPSPPPPVAHDDDDGGSSKNKTPSPPKTDKPTSQGTTVDDPLGIEAAKRQRASSNSSLVLSGPFILPPPKAVGVPQAADAYSVGGNLDVINDLVISFGSLTVASAQIALNPNNN